MKLPKGYEAHDGGECPVDPREYVDCIIRTGEGLGHSGPCRAEIHEWQAQAHADGLGAVVGYRLANPDEEIDVYERWPEA